MKLLVTLALVAIFRLGALLPLPGIDTSNLNLVTGSPDLSVIAPSISARCSFFFGPIVKMELTVPTAELNRAREIIRPDRIKIG